MAKPQVLFFSNNKVYSASKRDSRRQHTRIKANIGLIASTTVLLSSVRTEELMLRREGYKCYFSHFLFFFFILDFEISRVEAFVFILLDVTFFLFLLDKINRGLDLCSRTYGNCLLGNSQRLYQYCSWKCYWIKYYKYTFGFGLPRAGSPSHNKQTQYLL